MRSNKENVMAGSKAGAGKGDAAHSPSAGYLSAR